jgi:hypothetical protein
VTCALHAHPTCNGSSTTCVCDAGYTGDGLTSCTLSTPAVPIPREALMWLALLLGVAGAWRTARSSLRA